MNNHNLPFDYKNKAMKLKSEIFRINYDQQAPRTGNLIIAEPFLKEIWFQRGVICLVEYNKSGAMGLVLNKPSELYLNNLIEGLSDVEEIPVFYGGPLSNDRLFYMHTLGYLIPDSIEIKPGLYIGGDFEAITSYLKSGNKIRQHIKFFLGYSGWSAGQLDEEIGSHIWAVSPCCDPSECLAGEGDIFWKESVKKWETNIAPG